MTHRNRDDGDPLHLLTPREREVLELLRLGLTNGEIAARLEITLDGAKYHVSEIIGKLGVRDRHEAASYPERRPGWATALAPIAFLWRQAGTLVSVKASTVALVASAGLGAAALGGIGLIVFFLMQGGGGVGEEVSRQVADPFPQPIAVDTLAEARDLADFPVAAPAALPPGMVFAGANVHRLGGEVVYLAYRDGSADAAGAAGSDDGVPGVLITQSADGFGVGDQPSSTIDVQGVTGQIFRDQTPGLVVVYWQKDGITYSAVTYPNESFTEEDLLRMLNTME